MAPSMENACKLVFCIFSMSSHYDFIFLTMFVHRLTVFGHRLTVNTAKTPQ